MSTNHTIGAHNTLLIWWTRKPFVIQTLIASKYCQSIRKKTIAFFFHEKKNPTNEKANEFDYLPNLFEIIPTIIFLWPVFFLGRLFRFFNHHNEWRESKVYNRMLKEIMRSEAQANSLNVNIIITDGARERERCSAQSAMFIPTSSTIENGVNTFSCKSMKRVWNVHVFYGANVCLSVCIPTCIVDRNTEQIKMMKRKRKQR